MSAVDAAKSRVFIIEDDEFLVKAYQYIFEKDGFEVQVAADGNAAVEALHGPLASVVLLDLMLPGVDGFKILEMIGQDDRWKHVPVVILSNLSHPDNIKKGKELGAVDYLVKANTDIENVVSRVKLCLSKN